MRFTINNLSEVDMGLAPEKISREKRAESWNEVLNNVVKETGEIEIKRESKVVETKKGEKLCFTFIQFLYHY